MHESGSPQTPPTTQPDGLAIAALLEAAERTPTDPAVHRALAAAYRNLGQELDARVEESAAGALEAGTPLVIYNLATVYFMAEHRATAAKWYELALLVDPDLAIARSNLATIRFDEGRKEEARDHWRRAYTHQCVFVSTAPQERFRILILTASGYGNVPHKWLLPLHFYTQIKLIVEYATPEADAALPGYDLVFNAIGDPDVEAPTYAKTCERWDTRTTPFLNHPAHVSRTRRDRLPALLHGMPNVDVPPVLRVDGADAVRAAAAQPGFGFPLIVRPTASHGGQGLVRADDADGITAATGQPDATGYYLSPFRDYRSADGRWRKYRMIFVDRQPYPYHLAISPNWLVHYVTADMLSDPAKCAEEQRFLAEPDAVLGADAMAAIRDIGLRLDLDYAGVDFTLLPDGRVLVFEANATMLVHPEKQREFAYKNRAVNRILESFQSLVARRIEEGRAGLAG